MHEVKILHVSATAAVDYKNQLVADGLTMNRDFVWYYRKPRWDEFTGMGVEPSTVTFEFVDAKLATFYQLKWQ